MHKYRNHGSSLTTTLAKPLPNLPLRAQTTKEPPKKHYAYFSQLITKNGYAQKAENQSITSFQDYDPFTYSINCLNPKHRSLEFTNT